VLDAWGGRQFALKKDKPVESRLMAKLLILQVIG
jgi:hypothetical protein